MRDFSLHHKTAPPVPGFIPRNGDLVSARFSDGSWYRAKVRRASPQKKEAEVTFIDYGNKDSVSFADIRPLDPKFRGLSGQAHEARLRCVPYWYFIPVPRSPGSAGPDSILNGWPTDPQFLLVVKLVHRVDIG